jgi:hypothetical protein
MFRLFSRSVAVLRNTRLMTHPRLFSTRVALVDLTNVLP